MPPQAPNPALQPDATAAPHRKARRLLAALAVASAIVFGLLAVHAQSVTADPYGGPLPGIGDRRVARADTDTAAVPAPPLFPELEADTLAEEVEDPIEPGEDDWLGIGAPEPDSVAADSVAADSTATPDGVLLEDTLPEAVVEADSVAADSFRLAPLYFPEPRRERPVAPIVGRPDRPFQFPLGPYWRREALLDSTDFNYVVTEQVGGQDARVPVTADLARYRDLRREAALLATFRELSARRGRRAGPGGFGITIDIPGGNQSAFSTLFGKNEVDLRVNGQANIDLGFDYQQNELQEAATGQAGSLNPDFGQELNLGITGTIGDKLRVNVNYDTQNQFDFENQVSLVYEGYDDDIIQRIEAGNVFLQTPSELIRGGQRLFGLRTDLRFGGLGVTAVASQQDAESNALEIEGGTQTTEFSLAPYQYEDDTHFFLAYAFRNWWDEGHRDPNTRTVLPGFTRITNVEVWLHDQAAVNFGGAGEESETRSDVVAVLDLAEPGPGNAVGGAPANGVLAGADEYLAAFADNPALTPLPNPVFHQYEAADLDLFRDEGQTPDFEAEYDLAGADVAVAPFRKLQEGIDYTIDPYFGYISLKRSLTDNERIAVAYQYLTLDGTTVTVGDFGGRPEERIVLKLLRNKNPRPVDAGWGLTLRNIYRVGGRGLTPDAFDADVYYRPSGRTPQRTLPGVQIGQQQTLLQTLGLDRLNRDGALQPDDVFDFKPEITIDPSGGRVIFPVLEPFGAYMRRVLRSEEVLTGEPPVTVNFQGITQDAAVNTYVFDRLYDVPSDDAPQELPNIDRYAIQGEYRSSVQSLYELGFAVVEGSVRVTASGVELAEGADYIVNYTSGTVEITNPAYLTPGQNIRVEFEQNQFAAIGSKTLLGLRADYRVGEDFALGATWMRLSERPLVDKYRIGEEPLSNTIFGVDGFYQAEPRWMTRILDALPLITTRAPSRFEFKGEFAQLLPGHPETFAFDQERNALRSAGRDFKEDELDGLSFIDDFEGIENVYSLLQPGAWRLASAPDFGDDGTGAGPEDARPWTGDTTITASYIPTNWRGLFGWYALQQSLYRSDLCEAVDCSTPATRPVLTDDIFPERETRTQEAETITTLDLYFDPTQRGPYNYNAELETTFAGNPQDAWGAIVQRLPEGYTNFSGRNNIEFVEFIFRPVGGPDGRDPVSDDAVLYVDLGQVSEDVIPNRVFNSEDGLTYQPLETGAFDPWGRLPTDQPYNTVDLDENTNRTEDLGLDGLPSRAANPNGEPYPVGERDYFAEFVEALPTGTRARFIADEDPSADDYHHFEEEGYWNDGNRFASGRATLQERFTRFFPALEFNAFESQQRLTNSGEPGNSRYPDSEDLDNSGGLDAAESHWRYAVPLSDPALRQSPFFQSTIDTESGETWYLVRIPVRSEEREAVGGIQDFTLIENIRIWTEGHVRPATVRFATLELVGSQWLKSERVGITEQDPDGPVVRGDPRLFIETINNEEDRDYAIPSGALVSRSRDITGNLVRNREQAIVFRVEDLPEGASRAIYKPYTTNPLDLTKYSNLRMFVHAEGFERRDSLRVFLRLGANETEDYYEIEQPVYPFNPDQLATVAESARADSLWQTNVPVPGLGEVDLNSINVLLSELNQLKAERDANPTIPFDETYVTPLTPEGAPPGTQLAIRGNPSIQRVSTIVLGIRNASGGSTGALEDIELWFNELRATGYDEESGWSAYARTTLQLADFATLNARFAQQTDGFGELGSGLGDRVFQDTRDLSLLATVNAHKLLPERYGWNVPVTVSVTEASSTPRFAPRRGDLRVEELIAQVEEDPDLSAEEKNARIEEIREENQTSNYNRSIRAQISKTGSRSPVLRYLLDGLSLVYTNTATDARSPSVRLNDAERWTGSVTYRLPTPTPRTLRPFWFAEDVPILGILGGLRLNYLPQTFAVTADADRSITANQERPDAAVLGDTLNVGIPDRFLYPVRRNQTFGHGRTFDFSYNPFTFLSLTYRSDVSQSLSDAGANEAFELFVRGPDGQTATYGLSRDEAFDLGGPARLDFGIPDSVDIGTILQDYAVYEVRALDVLPAGTAVSNAFSGVSNVITDTYSQNFSASFQPRLDQYEWLRWFRPQPLTYSAQFAWSNTPLQGLPEDTTIAGVRTQGTLRGGLQLRPRELWRLLPFYRALEEAADATPETQESDSTDGRQGFRLPSPLNVARGLFLAITGVDDFTVTYNGTLSSSAGGLLGEGYSLLGGLSGLGPPLGYRLGLERRLGLDRRYVDANIPFQDNLGENHRFDARTQLRLTDDLLVSLTWDTSWDQTNNYTLERIGGVLEERPPVESGGGESTVLALGASYERLFDAFQQRYEDDVAANLRDTTGSFVLTDVLTTAGAADVFRSALVRGMGSFGSDGFFALPLPNWNITYSALGRLPLLRALSQQASLRHNYYATYGLRYGSNLEAGGLTAPRLFPDGAGGLVNVAGEIPLLEPSTVTLNERFQPLVGLDVTWKGGIQTTIDWNQSETYSLSALTSSVTRNTTDEVSLRVSFSTNGLRLPFMRRRMLNNALRFTLTMARTDRQDFAPRFLLRDLESSLGGVPLSDEQVTGSRRLTMEPRVSYTLSNQVSVDAFVRYESVDSRGSQIPSTSLLNGGFAFRVSFSN